MRARLVTLATAALLAVPATGALPQATPAALGCAPGTQLRNDWTTLGRDRCVPLGDLDAGRDLMARAALEAGYSGDSETHLEAVAGYQAMLARAEADRAQSGRADFRTSAGQVVRGSGHAWRQLGPTPTHATDPKYSPSVLGWDRLAGRVTTLAVDPRDRSGNTVYLGAAAGGVWKTTNGGKTWQHLSATFATESIGSIAVEANSGYVYVGTGEGNTNGDAYFGTGLYRSTNGGRTWTRRPGLPRNAVIPHVEVRNNFVYVATSRGLYRSANKGDSFHSAPLPTGGSAPNRQSLGNFVSDVRIRPSDVKEVTAAVGWRSGGISGAGLYRSLDAGVTWTRLPAIGLGVNPVDGQSADPIGRVSLAYAAAEQGPILWAVVQDPGKLNNENNPIAFTGPRQLPPSNLNGI
ncbi:MAG: hypothetical protein LC640_06195, partial [Frankia sp.]|nr:hypothetical protein [Frankia sp.]